MSVPFDQLRAPADVDASWLTEVCRRAGVGVGNRIVTVGATSIGTGQVGENVRFVLTWAEADDALPATVVGKFPSASAVSRATAVMVGTYTTEVGFYRDLQSRVAIVTPAVLHVGWNPTTHDFVIVMNDVAPAVQGDQLTGCGRREAELAVDQAVGLHAPTWGRTGELASLTWLEHPDGDGLAARAQLFTMLAPGFLDRYRDRLAPEDLSLAPVLIDRLVPWFDAVVAWADANGGWCVTHGDYRLDNMLFGSPPGSRALTVIDWQTVSIGIGPADVAYFCGAGLMPSARSLLERDLVQRYAAGLRRAGLPISDDAVWDGYVLGSVGGYYMAVLASQIVERTERGDEMFAVMAERHANQIRAVGLLDRLGVS